MVNYSTNLKTWGSTGQEFPDNYNYVEGEQPVDAWDNYFNSNVISDIEHLVDVTNNELLARDGSTKPTATFDLNSNDLEDAGATIWDTSLQEIPDSALGSIENSTLTNSSVTVAGQTVGLGGSTTLGLSNLDDYDLAGASLTDSTQGYLDFTGDGNDLRIATGQSIEDGGGTGRFNLLSDRTEIKNDAGTNVISALSGTATNINAHSGTPVTIYDTEQSATAVQYDTDASAGVLRTPNAAARIEANSAPSSGAGLELKYDTGSSTANIEAYDRGSSTSLPLKLTGSRIDLTNVGSNLRLATGQAIEDGGGNNRITLGGTTLDIHDSSGTKRAEYDDSGNLSLEGELTENASL